MSDASRRREWWSRPSGSGTPVNATARAAAYVPKPSIDEAEQLGIDHAAVLPSWLGMTRIPRLSCGWPAVAPSTATSLGDERLSGSHDAGRDGPTVTPQEAIDELEYVVTVLGLKAIMIDSSVDRVVPRLADLYDGIGMCGCRSDTYGIDRSTTMTLSGLDVRPWVSP